MRTLGRIFFLAFLVFLPGLQGVDSLVERSPFLPPGWGEEKAPVNKNPGQDPNLAHLQMKSLSIVRGIPMVSVHNTRDRSSVWLKQGVAKDGYLLLKLDMQEMAATVQKDGMVTTLKLNDPAPPTGVAASPLPANTTGVPSPSPQPTAQPSQQNRPSPTSLQTLRARRALLAEQLRRGVPNAPNPQKQEGDQ